MATTYEKIATNTLSTATATVTFSSISDAYTDLVLVINGGLTSNGALNIRYNGDTASNYSYTIMYGYGSGAGSGRASNTTFAEIGGAWSAYSTILCNIQNYSNSTTYKTGLSRYSDPTDTVGLDTHVWRSTSAITSLTMSTNGTTYLSGTTFNLYGIKAA